MTTTAPLTPPTTIPPTRQASARQGADPERSFGAVLERHSTPSDGAEAGARHIADEPADDPAATTSETRRDDDAPDTHPAEANDADHPSGAASAPSGSPTSGPPVVLPATVVTWTYAASPPTVPPPDTSTVSATVDAAAAAVATPIETAPGDPAAPVADTTLAALVADATADGVTNADRTADAADAGRSDLAGRTTPPIADDSDAAATAGAGHIAADTGAVVDTQRDSHVAPAEAQQPGAPPAAGDGDDPAADVVPAPRVDPEPDSPVPVPGPARAVRPSDAPMTDATSARIHLPDVGADRSLLARAELLRTAGRPLEVGISTSDLGRVRVTAAEGADGLQLQLSSDRPDGRARLGEHLQELRQDLDERGVGVGSLEVATGDARADVGRHGPDDELPTGGASMDAATTAHATAPPTVRGLVPLHLDGLDLRL